MSQNIEIIDGSTDPFGLRKVDFSVRIPERSEMFTDEEARSYIDGCDYPESADDLMLVLEIEKMLGHNSLTHMRVLDAMCGPGRLGREFLNAGAQSVTFHDGAKIMLRHADDKALRISPDRQRIRTVQSEVSEIPIPDDSFDLVICHNSTHQLLNVDKLHQTIKEFLRLTVPGGLVVIADYQRGETPEFIASLEERLRWTKPTIVPLLVPTFLAAFSKDEFSKELSSISGIATWSVDNAQPPCGLSQQMWQRINSDTVKGHILDFSPISLRAIARKEGT